MFRVIYSVKKYKAETLKKNNESKKKAYTYTKVQGFCAQSSSRGESGIIKFINIRPMWKTHVKSSDERFRLCEDSFYYYYI